MSQQIDTSFVVTSDAASPDLSGLHILLVDDDEINQMVVMDLLAKSGAQVSVADNGIEALAAVTHDWFDAILMDLMMPEMDGVEATLKIRERHISAELPIIAMSANATADDREYYLAAGMNDSIAKPIDAKALFEVLARWTHRSAPAARQGRGTVECPDDDLHHFDPDAALARGVNRSDFASMLGTFVESYGQAANSIQSALDNSDWKLAERSAHTLNGATATIGAPVLARLAGQLEAAIARREAETYPSLIASTTSELSRVVTLIKAHLQANVPGSRQ